MNNSMKKTSKQGCCIYRKLDHFDGSTTSQRTILSGGKIVISLK